MRANHEPVSSNLINALEKFQKSEQEEAFKIYEAIKTAQLHDQQEEAQKLTDELRGRTEALNSLAKFLDEALKGG